MKTQNPENGNWASTPVDNIMVGKLGSTELAAVSLGNSMIFVAMSIGIGFSTANAPGPSAR